MKEAFLPASLLYIKSADPSKLRGLELCFVPSYVILTRNCQMTVFGEQFSLVSFSHRIFILICDVAPWGLIRCVNALQLCFQK